MSNNELVLLKIGQHWPDLKILEMRAKSVQTASSTFEEAKNMFKSFFIYVCW